MKFSRFTINEIKEKSSIVTLVTEASSLTGSPLTRQGRSLRCLCPFHSEKSPSFYVFDEENTYHCFGCGVHGDPISFLMKIKGITFYDAVKELADRFGITLPDTSSSSEGARDEKNYAKEKALKKELFKVLHYARHFYEACLEHLSLDEEKENEVNQEKEAYKYIHSIRVIPADIIKKFHIGYAPREWSSLSKFLLAKGFREELLFKAGVSKRSSSGTLYDQFRGRLIFPILNDAGKTIAFGARTVPGVTEHESPKYINSSETPVYKKHATLYGLSQALKSIREEREVFVVEGYLDVISMHKAGINNVVASCGTALTKDHMERLSKITKSITLLFDGDAAGRAAAVKVFPLTGSIKADIWVVVLDEDEDPDSIVITKGEDAKVYILGKVKKPLFDVYLEHLIAEHLQGSDGNKSIAANTKVLLLEEIAKGIALFPNAAVRQEYIERGSRKLFSEPHILQKLVAKHRDSGLFREREKDLYQKIDYKDALDQRAGIMKVKGDCKAQSREAQNNDDRSEKNIKAIGDFNPVNREILKLVIILRQEIIDEILKDAELCSVLDPDILWFISEFNDILADKHNSEEEMKHTIKQLLAECGVSWVRFWKDAYELSKTEGVNFKKTFNDCYTTIRKQRLRWTIDSINISILKEVKEDVKLLLHQEKLSIIKQLDKVI
jgi:DNA primase